MIRAIVVAAMVVACGPSAPPSVVRAQPLERSLDAGGASDAGDAGAVDPMPTLEAIALRAASLTRGMREIARAEVRGAGANAELTRADARDVCVRVAFAANAAVVARIVDDKGVVLAERTGDAEGMLAARGPVCVRRGGALRVTFDGAATTLARFVAWAAP